MSARVRVVVTGIGPVTPVGVGVDPFWEGILAEKSGIRRMERFAVNGFKAKHSGEIRGFDPRAYFSERKGA